MPRRVWISRRSIAVLSTVVALACFGLGFAISYEPGDLSESVSATSTSTSIPPTTTVSPTTRATSTTTVAVTTSTALPTTALPTSSTVVTSLPTSTTLPPSPAVIGASYPRDTATGHMILRAGSTGSIVVYNRGGSPGSFTLQASGFVTIGSGSTLTGELQPGESRSIAVTAASEVPPVAPPQALISVFSVLGLETTIPVAIV